jgi:hypothetical protein
MDQRSTRLIFQDYLNTFRLDDFHRGFGAVSARLDIGDRFLRFRIIEIEVRRFRHKSLRLFYLRSLRNLGARLLQDLLYLVVARALGHRDDSALRSQFVRLRCDRLGYFVANFRRRVLAFTVLRFCHDSLHAPDFASFTEFSGGGGACSRFAVRVRAVITAAAAPRVLDQPVHRFLWRPATGDC